MTKPMSDRHRRRQLKDLRALIDAADTDAITKRIAYAMETAVRRVTDVGLVGWPSLVDEARSAAQLLAQELRR